MSAGRGLPRADARKDAATVLLRTGQSYPKNQNPRRVLIQTWHLRQSIQTRRSALLSARIPNNGKRGAPGSPGGQTAIPVSSSTRNGWALANRSRKLAWFG